MVKFRLRHASIPACIAFGPLAMTRIGGLIDGNLGVGLLLGGAILLTIGLLLMFELVAGQQAFLEKQRQIEQGVDA